MSEIKDRIMTALNTAVNYFNTGCDPETAIVKSASDNDFNIDQTARLTEVFNTARSIYHYKTASDKTSNFDLADFSKIAKQMFASPDVKPTVSSVDAYSDYDKPEIDYTKMSSDIDFPEPKDNLNDMTADNLFAQLNEKAAVYKDVIATALSQAEMYEGLSTDAINKVASTISRGYEDVCADQYRRLLAGYVKTANVAAHELAPVVNTLKDFVPAWLNKYAENLSTDLVIDDSGLDGYLSLLKSAHVDMQQSANLRAVAQSMQKDADELDSQINSLVSRYVATVKQPVKTAQAAAAVKSEPGSSETGWAEQIREADKNSPMAGLTSNLFSAAGSSMGKDLGKEYGDAMSRERTGQYKQLADRVSNARRQILLQDLMVNDPVLSEEDPQKLAGIYEGIMNLAPRLSQHKEVVRSILRQAAQSSSISPYDAESWVKLEKTIAEVTGKMPVKPEQPAGR